MPSPIPLWSDPLADSIGVGLVACDLDWKVLRCSAAAFDCLPPGPGLVSPLGLGDVLDDVDLALERLSPVYEAPTGAPNLVIRGVAVKRADRRVWVDVLVSAWPAGVTIPDSRPAWLVTLIDATLRVAADVEMARLRAKLSESERARSKMVELQEGLAEPVPTDSAGAVMIGTSAALQRVRAQVARVAPTSTTVLIHGETGSGKELVARSIHQLSDRKGEAFVPVNCGAIPETLIESEMFGHEKGAFTGADKRRLGKFELADGGTLFLDEIAELPLQSQAKLLRVLQEGVFERVGGSESVKVHVRVVAATHRDLARQVERGRFREDLFYRLNVFRIDVPPLRARRDDLRPLAEHLHERIARRMAKPVLTLSERSLRRIMAYQWPGNVRELANAVERATLLADGPELEIELPDAPMMGSLSGAPSSSVVPMRDGDSRGAAQTSDVLLDLTLEQLQRLQITHALERCEYRVFGGDGAAVKLEINPRTLLSRMVKYGIARPRQARRERRSQG